MPTRAPRRRPTPITASAPAPAKGRYRVPVIEARSLDFAYGSVQVLFGIDLTLFEGEVLAVLGANGAGKTTLLRVLAGLEHPSRGHVMVHGEGVTGDGAEQRVARGLSLVLGGQAVFRSLTVMENLRIGCYPLRRRDPAYQASRIDDVLALFPVLGARRTQVAGTLSGGEQQMLGIAKALLPRPQVLLLDELSLGLAPTVVADLLGVVQSLRTEGISMIVVEQSLPVALGLADRAMILEKGSVRLQASAAELRAREDLVQAAFLGGGV